MDTFKKYDDIALAEMSIARNPKAFGELVLRHQPRFLAVLSSRIENRNAISCEDVLHDAYASAWEKIHTLRDPEKFIPWFMITLLNMAKRRRTKEKQHKKTHRQLKNKKNTMNEFLKNNFLKISALFKSDPVSSNEKTNCIELMLKEIDILPEDERDVVSLYYFSDSSYAQIAEMLSISESQAKTRMKRAEGRLADKIKAAALGGAFAAYLNFTSPLPKVMAMIYSGELTPPAPEFLAAAGTTAAGTAAATTGSAAKSTSGVSFWSIFTSILSFPFLWLGSLLVSLQVLASTLVRNAPTYQARLWLVKQLFYGYCLIFLLPLFAFGSAFVLVDVLDVQLSETVVLTIFAIFLCAVFGYIIRTIGVYATIRKGSCRTRDLSAHRLKNAINFSFIGSAIVFMLFFGYVIHERYVITNSTQILINCLVASVILLACHTVTWLLFRHFILCTENESFSALPNAPGDTKSRRTFEEMKYAFPGYVLTTFGSLAHLLFIQEHNIYMLCEFLLFSGVWYGVLRKNINSPAKRISRILYTVLGLAILFVVLRFVFVAT